MYTLHFTMESSTLQGVKIVVNSIFFTLFALLFYFLHMKDAIEQYSKGMTTLGKSEEKIKEYDYPIFIVCPRPGFRSTKILNESIFWYYLYGNSFQNHSVTSVHRNKSFQFGEDWDIPGLELGKNGISGEIIEIHPIPTPHAQCIKIEYLFKLKHIHPLFGFLPIYIDVKINQKMDKLQQFDVFVAAENTWQGIVYNSWPYSQIPLKVSEKVPKPGLGRQLNFKIEENVWKHLKGVDETEDCLQELKVIVANCTSLFHPYSYQLDTM